MEIQFHKQLLERLSLLTCFYADDNFWIPRNSVENPCKFFFSETCEELEAEIQCGIYLAETCGEEAQLYYCEEYRYNVVTKNCTVSCENFSLSPDNSSEFRSIDICLCIFLVNIVHYIWSFQ